MLATGLTYLEFKNLMEQRVHAVNQKAKTGSGDTEQADEDKDKPRQDIMKFHYGFSTVWENIFRTAKTTNVIAGLLFVSWGEEPALQFNGTEWTSFYFRDLIRNP